MSSRQLPKSPVQMYTTTLYRTEAKPVMLLPKEKFILSALTTIITTNFIITAFSMVKKNSPMMREIIYTMDLQALKLTER